MTIIPLLIFLLAMGLVVIFEYLYALLTRHWATFTGKEVWVFLYWAALGMLGFICGLIPIDFGIKHWIPMVFVGVFHFISSLDGSWIRLPVSRPSASATLKSIRGLPVNSHLPGTGSSGSINKHGVDNSNQGGIS